MKGKHRVWNKDFKKNKFWKKYFTKKKKKKKKKSNTGHLYNFKQGEKKWPVDLIGSIFLTVTFVTFVFQHFRRMSETKRRP